METLRYTFNGIAERTSISSAADPMRFRSMNEAGFRKRQVWEEHRDRQDAGATRFQVHRIE